MSDVLTTETPAPAPAPVNTGRGGPTSPWPDERVEQLKSLVARGWSAGMIAVEMGGGLTRNAVLGKMHRLRLQGGAPQRHRPQVTRPRPPRPRAQAAPKPAPTPRLQARERLPMRDLDAALAAAPQLPPHQSGHAVPFIERRPGQCAWPLWDDATPQAARMFCGAPTLFEKCSYCARHARLAGVRA